MQKCLTWMVCCAAITMMCFSARDAQARPDYYKTFSDKYPDLKTLAEADPVKKCGVCHGADKKMRNDYGKAYGTALGEKNVKHADNAKKLEEALKKIESEKSGTDGKTFGDLIKDGKLPGK